MSWMASSWAPGTSPTWPSRCWSPRVLGRLALVTRPASWRCGGALSGWLLARLVAVALGIAPDPGSVWVRRRESRRQQRGEGLQVDVAAGGEHDRRPGADPVGMLEHPSHRDRSARLDHEPRVLGDQRMASTIESSDTVTTSSTSAVMCLHVSSPTAAERRPSAIVRPVSSRDQAVRSPVARLSARSPANCGLDGDHPRSRTSALDGRRDARDQPAAADRTRTVPRLSTWSSSSRPTVPWPAITCASSNGGTRAHAVLGRELMSMRHDLVRRAQDDGGSLGTRAGNLRSGGRLRHHHCHRDAGEPSCMGEPASVIARGVGDDAPTAPGRRARGARSWPPGA